MNAPRYLSVSILNTYIHNVFVAEELLHGIDVVGEVSGISVVRGHAYFTLKDRDAQIACNSFNCSKTYLPKKPLILSFWFIILTKAERDLPIF